MLQLTICSNEIVVPETTSSDENDTHIIQELKRRKYLFLKIDRLDQGACQKLISDYNDSVSEVCGIYYKDSAVLRKIYTGSTRSR